MKLTTPVDIIAFEACISHGNHNNTPLIDRHAEIARREAKQAVAAIMDAAHSEVDRIIGAASPYWRQRVDRAVAAAKKAAA